MNQSRGALTAQISRKRKERDDFFLLQSNNNNKGKQKQQVIPKTTSSLSSLYPNKPAPPKPTEPGLSNRLLAGYLAHEFLSNGTLLGQAAQAVSGPGPARPDTKAYAEVASLLKTSGAHIAGVVNPSQLAKWIQR